MANLVNKFIKNIQNNINYKKLYIFNDIENQSLKCPILKLEEIKNKINIIQQEDLIVIIISDNVKDYDMYFEEFSKLTLMILMFILYSRYFVHFFML